jgi:hypothetical protein
VDWESTPAAAATSEINRGRIETRTIRVLPAPDGLDFPYARQAILLERYVTIKRNGRWTMRNCEAVLYVTSLDASQATPADLRPHPRPLDDRAPALATWSGTRANPPSAPGNAPPVLSALTNLAITLFRLQGVTKITEETRRNAQNPRRPLQLLALRPG